METASMQRSWRGAFRIADTIVSDWRYRPGSIRPPAHGGTDLAGIETVPTEPSFP